MVIRNNLDFFSFLIRPTIVRNVYEVGIIKTYALECENVKGSLPFYIQMGCLILFFTFYIVSELGGGGKCRICHLLPF